MAFGVFFTKLICLLSLLSVTASEELTDDLLSSTVNSVNLIEKYGYPVETHTVTTSDGYILSMHRIPYSEKNRNDGSQRSVVFVMHGLLCSSSDWLVGGPENGLGFILADAGYDVWMGNARGNTYSRKHVTKSASSQSFWDFEWHQIAIDDLPTMFNYVLDFTKVAYLRYIGHSQGTTTFFALNSLNSLYKNRIKAAFLLAPVVFLEHAESPLVEVFGSSWGRPNPYPEKLGSFEFAPNGYEMELLGSLLCQAESVSAVLCTCLLYLIGGWNSPYINKTMTPVVLSTSPAGASFLQIQHFMQMHNSASFEQFDYGTMRNIKAYGSADPTEYDLSKIQIPLHLYYSDNDYFAHLKDVERLRNSLPPEVLKVFYQLPQKGWNHVDFLWGLNVKGYLYDRLLDDMKNS